MSDEQNTLLKVIQELRDEIARLRVVVRRLSDTNGWPLFHGKGKP